MRAILDFLRGRATELSAEDELLFEFVANELQRGEINKGLWAKALTDAEFIEAKAKSLYVNMRVAALRRDFRQQLVSLQVEAEQEARIQDLLARGCDREAIDYLGNPILARDYAQKHRLGLEKINKAVELRKLKGYVINGTLWVEDRRI